MEVLTQKINTISITFSQSEDDGLDEISPFLTSLPKLNKFINEVGFGNTFSKTERSLWNAIIEHFSVEEDAPVVTSISAEKVYVDEEEIADT